MGFTTVYRVAGATGLTKSTVESELIDLAVAGLVTHEFGGWGLTDRGRKEDAVLIAAELRVAGRDVITQRYHDFLVLNPELLDLCTAWQTRSTDAVVLDLFADFHVRADAVLAGISVALPRFEHYRRRLATALDRAAAGETQFLTEDLEAYHTVWFQLHEDLLATLGIPR